MIERSEERDEALTAALPHVPALGWTRAALSAGLADLGRDPLEQDWLFQRGPVEAIEAWCDLLDRRMAEAAAEDAELPGLRTTARVRRLVLLRFALAAPYREAVRRAVGRQLLPSGLPSALRCAARTADAIWLAAGDESADVSRYTRRATLAALHAATLAFWLQDETPGQAATAAFLDRRLAAMGRNRRGNRKA